MVVSLQGLLPMTIVIPVMVLEILKIKDLKLKIGIVKKANKQDVR